MNTKVKGEAIKDKSVGLNALVSGDFLLQNYTILYEPEFSIGKNGVYYNNEILKNIDYVYVEIYNYDGVLEFKKGTTITLNRGPVTYLTWDDNGIKINSYADYYKVKGSRFITQKLKIDPVVWKYMCNPHIMTYKSYDGTWNNPIPKELSDIIYQNGKFNQLVLSTILVELILDEDYISGDVKRITSYTKEGGGVYFDDSQFYYDPDTRLFIV